MGAYFGLGVYFGNTVYLIMPNKNDLPKERFPDQPRLSYRLVRILNIRDLKHYLGF